MKCPICSLPNVMTDICPRCGMALDHSVITIEPELTAEQRLQARVRELEHGISTLIDQCQCTWTPGPNSCPRCKVLIQLLEGN